MSSSCRASSSSASRRRGPRRRARPRASTASRSPSARSRSCVRRARRSRSARARVACASRRAGSGAARRARAGRSCRVPRNASRRAIAQRGPRALHVGATHARGRSTSSLDGSRAPVSRRGAAREPNYITRAGARRLQDELVELRTKQRPKVVQDVADAAAQGDRSENAEYIYGKKKLREIDRRIHFLTKRLETRTVVEPADRDRARAIASSSARPSTIEDEDGKTSTYQIVGAGRDRPRRAGASATSRRSARALLKRQERRHRRLPQAERRSGAHDRRASATSTVSGRLRRPGCGTTRSVCSRLRADSRSDSSQPDQRQPVDTNPHVPGSQHPRRPGQFSESQRRGHWS